MVQEQNGSKEQKNWKILIFIDLYGLIDKKNVYQNSQYYQENEYIVHEFKNFIYFFKSF